LYQALQKTLQDLELCLKINNYNRQLRPSMIDNHNNFKPFRNPNTIMSSSHNKHPILRKNPVPMSSLRRIMPHNLNLLHLNNRRVPNRNNSVQLLLHAQLVEAYQLILQSIGVIIVTNVESMSESVDEYNEIV
jgi:hypothetical protein